MASPPKTLKRIEARTNSSFTSARHLHDFRLPGRGKTEPIYAYRFNARTGKLTPLGLAAETVNPGFLAVHPNHQFLYTVNEVSDFRGPDTGGVSAFRIDRKPESSLS